MGRLLKNQWRIKFLGKNIIRRKKFSVYISQLIIALILMTMGIIITVTFYAFEKVTINISKNLMIKANDTVIKEVEDYFSRASDFAKILGGVVGENSEDILNDKALENFMLRNIASYPQLDAFAIGTEDGDFVMVQRNELRDKKGKFIFDSEGKKVVAFFTKKVNRDPKIVTNREEPLVDWVMRDERFNVTGTKKFNYRTKEWDVFDLKGKVTGHIEESKAQNYDPRMRGWYKGVVGRLQQNSDTPEVYWSSPYVFASKQVLGITAAYPILDNKRKLRGVAMVDITLAAMQEFMNRFSIGENGVVYILTNKLPKKKGSREKVRMVLAQPEVMLPQRQEGEKLSLKPVSESRLEWVRPPQDFLDEPQKPCDKGFIGTIDNLLDRIFYIEDGGDTGKQQFYRYCSNDEDYLAVATNFSLSKNKIWNIMVVVPEADFVGAMLKVKLVTMLIMAIAAVIALIMAVTLSQKVSKPIKQLALATKKIQEFDLADEIDIQTGIVEVGQMVESVQSMRTGLQSFRRYVPAELVRELIRSGQGVGLGGQRKKLTIFFSDIEDFTSISERLGADELVQYLSKYFAGLSDIIMKERGTIDKFIGDSIMAFWNAPLEVEGHQLAACRTVLACLKCVDALEEEWRKTGRELTLRTRVGLHTANVIVGNVGSEERMDYTILGDGVNLASRLEGANKYYGTQVLVSQDIYDAAQHEFLFRKIDMVAVKGRENVIGVYELIGELGAASPGELEWAQDTGAALKLYRERDFEGACKKYEKILQLKPTDLVAKKFIENCRQFIESPPPSGWDGVSRLADK